MYCRLHLKGHLDPFWQEWLSGLTLLPLDSDTTLLVGDLPDQAALYGVLATLSRLHLSLLDLSTHEQAQNEGAYSSQARPDEPWSTENAAKHTKDIGEKCYVT